jgi:ferredoxin
VAAAQASAGAELESLRRELTTEREAAVAEARATAARDAFSRLARGLLELDALPARAGGAPALATPLAAESPGTPALVARPAPAGAPPSAAEDEGATGFDDPWVDSVLCTSCNECIQINRRLFGYDENKQARIADATAGTYAELVAAAEKCPARCIHPGQPRSGDATATDDLVARAARFA